MIWSKLISCSSLLFSFQESRGKRPLKIWDSLRSLRKGLVVGSFEELLVRGSYKHIFKHYLRFFFSCVCTYTHTELTNKTNTTNLIVYVKFNVGKISWLPAMLAGWTFILLEYERKISRMRMNSYWKVFFLFRVCVCVCMCIETYTHTHMYTWNFPRICICRKISCTSVSACQVFVLQKRAYKHTFFHKIVVF